MYGPFTGSSTDRFLSLMSSLLCLSVQEQHLISTQTQTVATHKLNPPRTLRQENESTRG